MKWAWIPVFREVLYLNGEFKHLFKCVLLSVCQPECTLFEQLYENLKYWHSLFCTVSPSGWEKGKKKSDKVKLKEILRIQSTFLPKMDQLVPTHSCQMFVLCILKSLRIPTFWPGKPFEFSIILKIRKFSPVSNLNIFYYSLNSLLPLNHEL